MSVLSYEKDESGSYLVKYLIHTGQTRCLINMSPKNNRKFNMEKEDNKNYGSVTIVTLITLLASLVNLFNITVLN